jgi:hypothetical protein
MTAQIHEVLFIDGEKMSMAFCPPLPMDHPRIVAEDLDAVVKRSPESRILFSTACWRGYQGTWRIEDGRFFVVRVEGRYRLDGDAPLLADWFTGVLRVPRGAPLRTCTWGSARCTRWRSTSRSRTASCLHRGRSTTAASGTIPTRWIRVAGLSAATAPSARAALRRSDVHGVNCAVTDSMSAILTLRTGVSAGAIVPSAASAAIGRWAMKPARRSSGVVAAAARTGTLKS